MFKFVHAADIHLDSPLQGLERYESAPVDEIRGATRRAFERLVELAIDERADFVVIAGDLYDGDWKDVGTGLYFARQMARLKEAEIRAFIIHGNHDAANTMTRHLVLPDNVFRFPSRAPDTVTLEDLNVSIHGQSFASRSVTDDLAARYPKPVSGAFNIGLLHTSVAGSAEHANYAPCSLETLQQRGYDYWALGHVHTRATLSDEPPVEFPGNTQGRHIRETGEKGCLVVNVDDGGKVEREFRALDVVRWLHCEVSGAGVESIEDLAAAFRDKLRELHEANPDRLLAVRTTVSGASRADGRLRAQTSYALDQLRSAAFEVGHDEIWLESLKIETTPYEKGRTHEGPFEEVAAYAAELVNSELMDLIPEFADLLKRLPAELRGEDTAPGLLDPESLQRSLREATALLEERMVNEEPES